MYNIFTHRTCLQNCNFASMEYWIRKKRNRNVFKAIINRQIYGAIVLQDIRTIRTMIESNRTFKKVYEVNSKSPIVCEGDRLYTNSFGTCYELTPVGSTPRIVYSLQRRPLIVTTKRKIEALLVFECPLEQTTFSKVQGTFYANGPYSFGVTADNYLKVFDFKTGMSFEQVYLLPRRKFKYLYWETDLGRLAVQSTLLPQNSTAHVMQRVPTQTDQVLLYIAVFTVTPLEFICMLPISHKIFGTDVCNANVRNGMLIVMYRRGKLQLFNLEDIIKNHTIPLKLKESLEQGNNLCLPEIDELTSGVVGIAPLGLPVNVTLLEKPSVLFEVVSNHHDLSFGGYPWHYITNNDNIFHVRSIKDHVLAENGTVNDDGNLHFGTEKAFFHSDLSGRILHIAPSYLRCLKFGPGSSVSENKTHKLHEKFILDYRLQTKVSSVRTKSGRKVKQLLNTNHVYLEIIQDVDYDDELDLLVVLYLNQVRKGEGIVGFYDNQTGQHIHELGIDDINEEHEHSIAINRNILIILSKHVYKCRCLVYHLDHANTI